jgi:hypothetical protein
MARKETNPDRALADFGFSELESHLYYELLRAGPATGYRLAHLTGKAPANVYQALAGMTRKGIVFVEEGEAKSFRALPPAELMTELQQDFEHRRTSALAALEKVHSQPKSDRIYQLRSAKQAMERAQSMIAAAREIVLFDLHPQPFALLRGPLQSAADAGRTIAGVTYGDPPDVNFICVTTPGVRGREPWPGQQLTVIVDAAEYLIALLTPDGERVIHGIWSESRYLACLEHSGLSSEIRLSALAPKDDVYAPIGLLHAVPAGLRELAEESASAADEEMSADQG